MKVEALQNKKIFSAFLRTVKSNLIVAVHLAAEARFLDHRSGASFTNKVFHMNLFQYLIFILCAALFSTYQVTFILYDRLLNKCF